MKHPSALSLWTFFLELFWCWTPASARRLGAYLMPVAKGWKCLSPDGGSTTARNPVKYGVYKWTVPRMGEGPLCVFTTRSAAHRFAFGQCRGESAFWVVPCWYVPSRRRFLHQWCVEGRIDLLPRDSARAEAVGIYWNQRECAGWRYV